MKPSNQVPKILSFGIKANEDKFNSRALGEHISKLHTDTVWVFVITSEDARQAWWQCNECGHAWWPIYPERWQFKDTDAWEISISLVADSLLNKLPQALGCEQSNVLLGQFLDIKRKGQRG